MEQPKKESALKKPWVQSIIGIIVVIGALAGAIIYKIISSRVSIDLGTIEAPVIVISPEEQGILDEVYVRPGDEVNAGEAIAHVGGETLFAKISGTILAVQNVPGQVFNPGTPVATMIDPDELRVVGTIDENKGLTKIKVGDTASFTVDAFGSEEFVGIVDEISPTSKQSGVAFSISDKREIRQFTVKIKYDNSAHTDFKNGMSAKIKIYTK
jgi:multidrug resistance efflux pump